VAEVGALVSEYTCALRNRRYASKRD